MNTYILILILSGHLNTTAAMQDFQSDDSCANDRSEILAENKALIASRLTLLCVPKA